MATGTVLTTTGAALSSGIAAGLSTLASQAAVSLINNKGDLGKTFKDLSSDSSVKQLVASILTAGLAQQATGALQEQGLLVKDLRSAGFTQRFATYATQATAAAGVKSVVLGQPLSDSLRTALVDSLTQSLTSQIGDWGQTQGKGKETLIAKAIAHAVVQCASARVAGSDCASAAIGAVTAEALSPFLEEIDARRKEAGFQQTLGSSIASLSTVLVASLSGKDVNAALKAAQTVEVFNRQLHDDEKQRIKELSKGDPQKEARLTAAACARVRCYAEYPEGSQIYDTLKRMADLGATYTAEQNLLRQQQGLFTYSTNGFFSDENRDAAKRIDNTYQVTTRALGAGQAVLGGAALATSIASAPATCATGIGCVANALGAGISIDAIYTGSKQAAGGQSEQTLFNQAFQGLGLSPEAASYAELVLGVGAAAKAGSVASAATASQGVTGVGSAADNIYSSMRPMTSDFPELNGVNPHYVENAGLGINTNCVSCVNAAHQRLTGQSLDAVADATKYSNQNGLLPSAPFGFGPTTTPAAVIDEMIAAGNGATRLLIIQQPGNTQHVINVVNRNGQVYFIDSQMGQIVTLHQTVPVKLGRP